MLLQQADHPGTQNDMNIACTKAVYTILGLLTSSAVVENVSADTLRNVMRLA
jgi:hypothetical protein